MFNTLGIERDFLSLIDLCGKPAVIIILKDGQKLYSRESSQKEAGVELLLSKQGPLFKF